MKAGSSTGPDSQPGLLDSLKSHWSSLPLEHKLMAGGGGLLAAGSVFNQLRPRSDGDQPSLMGNLAGLTAGLGTAAYGLSGGQPQTILPKLQGLLGHRVASTPGTMISSTTSGQPGGPQAGPASTVRLRNPDGSVNFQAAVKATDPQLQQEITQLDPAHRQQLLTQLQGFQPSFGQRMGAKAMGIDIDEQRARFQRLLAPAQASNVA